MNAAMTLHRKLEDYFDLPFGSEGQNSGCSLTWSSEYESTHTTWYYECLYGQVYGTGSNQDGDDANAITYMHKQSCWGQDADFDNFSCRLAVHKNSQWKVYGEPDPFSVNVECTEQDGCTCQGAAVDGNACDVCSTCSTFSTEDVANWMKKNTIPEALELSCVSGAGLSQTCPATTRTTALNSTLPYGGEWGWILGGFVVGVAATVTYYVGWCKKRHSSTHVAPLIETKTATDGQPSTDGQLAL